MPKVVFIECQKIFRQTGHVDVIIQFRPALRAGKTCLTRYARTIILNPVLRPIMKITRSRFLLGIFYVYILSTLEAANKVSFQNISELESGNLRIVFNLDKIALINSYALDDPSRIVIDLKNTDIAEPIQSKSFSPIKLIRASEVGGTTRIVIDLRGSVYWKNLASKTQRSYRFNYRN